MSNYTVITSDYLEHSTFGDDYVSNNPHVNGPNNTVRNLTFRQRDSGFSKTSRGTYIAYLAYHYSPGYGAHFPVEYYKGFTEASIQHYIKVTLNNMLPDAVVTPNEIRKGASFAAEGFRKFENSHGSKAIRHSAVPEDADIIDVSDTLQHAQHEGYYSPNNTANKATPYIFEKLVKSSAGNQIGARFKGQGDRQWVEIFVPTVDFTPNMQNFIALFNAEKGNVKIREEEMRKAARLLTNFFNSPSLPGNEKMTTYVRKPKSLKHALFTEVYDMDDYLEHHGILGMKWGVRRYQNKDGSLTAEGRKHYNVKTINSTRMELAGAESDREKRTILTKATNKAVGDQVKGIVAGTGSMVAGSLAKQAVARAAAGTVVRDLVYNSLTGTSSLITSVIPAAVPAWAAALTTPVGQIALAAVGTAGAAKAIYGAYKEFKLNELAAEFDVSTNVNRIVREQTSVNSAAERGMQEYRENKANRMINALDSNNSAAYEKERNSIKDDYEKDRMEYVVDRVRAARQSGKYDMEFLERGLDQNQRTGEDLEGKDLDEAYLRYLLEKEKS